MVIVSHSTARWTNSYSHFTVSNNPVTVLSLGNAVTGKVLFGENYPYSTPGRASVGTNTARPFGVAPDRM